MLQELRIIGHGLLILLGILALPVIVILIKLGVFATMVLIVFYIARHFQVISLVQ